MIYAWRSLESKLSVSLRTNGPNSPKSFYLQIVFKWRVISYEPIHGACPMCFKITVDTPYGFFRQLTLQKLKTERKQKVGSARTNKLTAHISHLLVGKHELLFPQDMAPYSLEDATHSQQNERQVSANVLFLVSWIDTGVFGFWSSTSAARSLPKSPMKACDLDDKAKELHSTLRFGQVCEYLRGSCWEHEDMLKQHRCLNISYVY